MTEYKKWEDLPYHVKDRMRDQFVAGTEFEMSYNGENWFEMQRATSFYISSYYRVKGETTMTDDMTPFGKLDPVKQGEILVAFRNGDPNLQQWFCHSKEWGDLKGIRQIFNDVVYRFKAAPRECYVQLHSNGDVLKSSCMEFTGSVLMREVMED
jgi:hypothetical protein